MRRRNKFALVAFQGAINLIELLLKKEYLLFNKNFQVYIF